MQLFGCPVQHLNERFYCVEEVEEEKRLIVIITNSELGFTEKAANVVLTYSDKGPLSILGSISLYFVTGLKVITID